LVLAFLISAVSPAVVVPSMLELQEKGLGKEKAVPTMILAGASLDDVFAITMFSLFWGWLGGKRFQS
jgi:NhaP-type Na+/H+ or K+/H+ antiporter